VSYDSGGRSATLTLKWKVPAECEEKSFSGYEKENEVVLLYTRFVKQTPQSLPIFFSSGKLHRKQI